MKAHDHPRPCGSTLRNTSCSCLRMAVALRLLYSTHYYQEILTFSIKGKRGRNREADFKGCLASIFFSLERPVIPQVSLVFKQPPWQGNSHPLESQIPIRRAFCPDSLLQDKGIKLTRFPLHPCPCQGTIACEIQRSSKRFIFSHIRCKVCPTKYTITSRIL